jgi:hypothetical protein
MPLARLYPLAIDHNAGPEERIPISHAG